MIPHRCQKVSSCRRQDHHLVYLLYTFFLQLSILRQQLLCSQARITINMEGSRTVYCSLVIYVILADLFLYRRNIKPCLSMRIENQYLHSMSQMQIPSISHRSLSHSLIVAVAHVHTTRAKGLSIHHHLVSSSPKRQQSSIFHGGYYHKRSWSGGVGLWVATEF